MRYDYEKEMYKDIEEYIEREFGVAILCEMPREDAYEKLYDELWTCDSVTGNGSGSYFFNAYQASEALDWELMAEASEEFGLTTKGIAEGPEYWDVTIRCYLLGRVLNEVLDDLYEEFEEPEEEEEEFDLYGEEDEEND